MPDPEKKEERKEGRLSRFVAIRVGLDPGFLGSNGPQNYTPTEKQHLWSQIKGVEG